MKNLGWWARIGVPLVLVVALTSCKPNAQSPSAALTDSSSAGIVQNGSGPTLDLSTIPDIPTNSTTPPPPAPVPVDTSPAPAPVTTTAPQPPAPASTAAAPPAPAEQTFANCAALNAVYPHGVGRAGAVDHVASPKDKPVTDFTVDNALYAANASHDRDGDGIACERD